MSHIWQRIYNNLVSNFGIASRGCLHSYQLYKKIHFTTQVKCVAKINYHSVLSYNFSHITYLLQALKKNWLAFEFSRESTSYMGKGDDCIFKIGNKFIAWGEYGRGVFAIWNRLSLKLEEVYSFYCHLYAS